MRLLILTLLLPTLLLAQEFTFEFQPEGIPVEINGWSPFSPWAGGEMESVPHFSDIDGDGDLDGFLGNVSGKLIIQIMARQLSPSLN